MDKTEFSLIGDGADVAVLTRHDPQGASWDLGAGEVLRLPIGPGSRRLRVLGWMATVVMMVAVAAMFLLWK